jgi:diketogulonate reductase-like aldo/keto reductase
MGDNSRRRKEEIAAIRAGLDLGSTVIDTAEMYGSGAAEKLVGEAIHGRREGVFLVSKVLPEHATRRETITACERSLKRLATDHLDLYLLHWRGDVPLEETVAGFSALQEAGKIRYWGVSNFDTPDMEELVGITGGADVATNQVLYNLVRRGIERDLLPWCAAKRLPIMAYSPIEQGRMLKHRELREVAGRIGATSAQVALAWVTGTDGVMAIPKAGTVDHVKENCAALDLHLTADDRALLDGAFPPPAGKVPLEML